MKDQSDAMIAAINKTVAWAQANQMTVVYIRQENTDLVFNFLTGGLLAKGRPGAEIDKRVNVVSTNIFGKQKMDAFWNPDFAAFLRSQGITTMYVTGLDAANCVDRTIKGALVRGYKVIALKDGIISDTPEKGLAMINEYVKEGVTITTSAELPVPAPQTPVVTIKSKR
jgi:nicotinamidase-related amidase